MEPTLSTTTHTSCRVPLRGDSEAQPIPYHIGTPARKNTVREGCGSLRTCRIILFKSHESSSVSQFSHASPLCSRTNRHIFAFDPEISCGCPRSQKTFSFYSQRLIERNHSSGIQYAYLKASPSPFIVPRTCLRVGREPSRCVAQLSTSSPSIRIRDVGSYILKINRHVIPVPRPKSFLRCCGGGDLILDHVIYDLSTFWPPRSDELFFFLGHHCPTLKDHWLHTSRSDKPIANTVPHRTVGEWEGGMELLIMIEKWH